MTVIYWWTACFIMMNAYQAAQTCVAIVDRSHWGRIRVCDQDRLQFLHNQTTNAFQGLQPGQGCDTVFVTATARTLDLVTGYVEPEAVLLLTSPNQADALIAWMDRYIFFADKVKLENLTASTFAFTVLGPDADQMMTRLGLAEMVGKPHGAHGEVALGEPDIPIKIAVGSGLALPGYTLIGPQTQAAAVWQALREDGAMCLDAAAWERLRIEQGRPMPGQELTEANNPLEAGLWHAVSFSKGCYIGQETIARLNTYQGVKQQLWGLRLDRPAEPGAIMTLAGEKIGQLTSCVPTPAGAVGLGYLRTKAGGAGLTVQIGDAAATVVEVPYLNRGYLSALAT
jgi:hypothetical protein